MCSCYLRLNIWSSLVDKKLGPVYFLFSFIILSDIKKKLIQMRCNVLIHSNTSNTVTSANKSCPGPEDSGRPAEDIWDQPK